MKFFRANGTPLNQPEPSETTKPTKRRMPFVRRFISVDGEKTLFVEEREVSPPPPPPQNSSTVTTPTTITCSDEYAASPFRSLWECGHDLSQLTLEPPTITTSTTTATTSTIASQQGCSPFNYSHAIKTALLLDDDDESLILRKEQQQVEAVPPPPALRSNHSSSLFDDSTVDYDLQNRLNKSHADLMDDAETSPGAIRLTKEGLQRHERKTFTTSGNKGRAFQQREMAQGRREECDSNATPPRRYSHQDKKHLLRGKLKRFKSAPSAPNLQRQESMRIEKKRQKEAHRQRQREARAAKLGYISITENTVEERKTRKKKKKSKKKDNGQEPTTTLSRTSTTSLSSSLALVQESPCVLCDKRARTHIAIPCMHFSYCHKCAHALERNQEPCLVCGTANASYKKVFA